MSFDPNTGEFVIEDRQLRGGVRQDMSFSDLRTTVMRNVEVFRKNAVKKRKGYRPLNSTALPGDVDILAGLDAQFSGGTQKVIVVAGTDAYIFDSATRTFTAQSLALASAKPSMLMFADYAIVVNGTDVKKYNGTTWSNMTGAPNAPYAAIHKNRLILAGDSGAPYQFFFSGVRNPDSWDQTNDTILVTTPKGEEITGLGSLGDDLVVFTRSSTYLYWQNPNAKGDWDLDEISNTIGNISHHSYHEVSHLPFGLGLFWSEEGPYVLYRLGRNSKPVMQPLWEFIDRMVDGETTDVQLEGFNTARFESVVSGYQPKNQEVRMGLSLVGAADNNAMLCFDLRSLLAFIGGQIDAPDIMIKDNANTGIYPCDALFQVKVDSDGLPSTTGKLRQFGGRDGVIYELDETYKDNGNSIPFYVRKSGYSGAPDGIGEHEKVLTHVRVSATQNIDFGLVVEVSADGGADVGSTEIDLDAQLGAWGDGGVWSDDPNLGTWNGAVVKSARGDIGIRGKVFEVSIYDQGAIDGEFEMDRIVLEGTVYERQ